MTRTRTAIATALLVTGAAMPIVAQPVASVPSTWLMTNAGTPSVATVTEVQPNGTSSTFTLAGRATTLVRDPSGTGIFAVNNTTAGRVDFHTTGGSLQFSFVPVTFPSQIAFTNNTTSTIWVLTNNALLAPPTVHSYTLAGTLSVPPTVLPGSLLAGEIEADGLGNLWVAGSFPPALYFVTNAGTVSANVPLGSVPADIAVGPGNEAWVANGTTTVNAYAPGTGAIVATLTTPLPIVDVAVDGCGYVWCASVTGVVYVYAVGGATLLTTITVPTLTTLTDFQPDTRGGFWATGLAGGVSTAVSVSRTGALQQTVSLAGTLFGVEGDMTGVEAPVVLAPVVLAGVGRDVDADLAPDALEFSLGMDPIDPASVPSTTSAAVTSVNPTTVTVSYSDALNPNAPYILAASTGTPPTSPGIPLLPPLACPAIPLTADAIFTLSTTPGGGGIFTGFTGGTLVGGSATGTVNIPAGVSIGTTIYFAGASLTASGGLVLSPSVGVFVP